MKAQSIGIELISKERQRQIEKEGFDSAHDDQHFNNELALAAICYAAPYPIFIRLGDFHFVDPWPDNWDADWDKRKRKKGELSPSSRTKKQEIRDLVKAGASIAAEIDRLEREEGESCPG